MWSSKDILVTFYILATHEHHREKFGICLWTQKLGFHLRLLLKVVKDNYLCYRTTSKPDNDAFICEKFFLVLVFKRNSAWEDFKRSFSWHCIGEFSCSHFWESGTLWSSTLQAYGLVNCSTCNSFRIHSDFIAEKYWNLCSD